MYVCIQIILSVYSICLVDGCQGNAIDATCTDIPNGIGGSRSANIERCGVAILNVLQFVIFYFWC